MLNGVGGVLKIKKAVVTAMDMNFIPLSRVIRDQELRFVRAIALRIRCCRLEPFWYEVLLNRLPGNCSASGYSVASGLTALDVSYAPFDDSERMGN